MSIRLIAKDLYRVRQEVAQLEKDLESTPWPTVEQVRDLLRKKRAALTQLQRMLEGAKDPPPYRRPL
jgi:hypothetical protein